MLKLEHIDRSDNFRIIGYDRRPQTEAFMQLIENIEAGTGLIRLPGSDGTATGEAVHIGARVSYRAIAGDVYDAVVTTVRAPQRDASGGPCWVCDIDVTVPGLRDPVHFTRIRIKP